MSGTPHEDTLFLDPAQALATAKQGNRIPLTLASTGLQVCYYIAQEPIAESLPNLIHVRPDALLHFFSVTRLRPPTRIVFSNGMDEDMRERLNLDLEDCLGAARLRRQMLTRLLSQECRQTAPPPSSSPAVMRVLGWASRTTTVMQYATKGLLEAFAGLGHETRLVIETQETESLDGIHLLQELHAFKPHILLNINHIANESLHPDVFNIVWWQDIMPELRSGEAMPWRERDLVYVLHRDYLQRFLVRAGLDASRIRVQPCCINPHVFHDQGTEPRQHKVVYVGVSYAGRLDGSAAEGRLLRRLQDMVENAVPLNRVEVEDMALREGVDPEHAWSELVFYLTKDLPVRWLCRQKDIPVEVYGRFWERDPLVAPFFKGEVAHGPALAAVLRSARFALSTHPFLLNHQRLGESVACGCIPLVFDCRHASDPPHWDDHCLFFRDEPSLHAALRSPAPKGVRGELIGFFDYRVFARRILSDLHPQVVP